MAIKFVKVRRVDDHSRTAELAEVSLPVWEGVWERIPDAEQQPADGGGTGTTEPTSTPPSRKSRSSAASTDKE